MFLLPLLLISLESQAQPMNKTFRKYVQFKVQLDRSEKPHAGMQQPKKIGLKTKISTLMQKHECYLHLIKPLVIQRDAEYVEAGTLKLNVVKQDFYNRRLLPAGTHLKLNSIITDVQYGFGNKITIVDSVISDVSIVDFWESKIQKQNVMDIYLASDQKLFLECSAPEITIVR